LHDSPDINRAGKRKESIQSDPAKCQRAPFSHAFSDLRAVINGVERGSDFKEGQKPN